MSQTDVKLSNLADRYEGTTTVNAQEANTVTTEPNDTPVAEATPVVKAKKSKAKGGRVGRPVDTAGNTTKGKARLIHLSNPNFTNIQLRDEIVAKTNCSKSVANTYASLLKTGKN